MDVALVLALLAAFASVAFVIGGSRCDAGEPGGGGAHMSVAIDIFTVVCGLWPAPFSSWQARSGCCAFPIR